MMFSKDRHDDFKVAQRLALLALGRDWILFGSRENSKPEKCLKSRTAPQRAAHAMLAQFM